jgi:hypothetical protein
MACFDLDNHLLRETIRTINVPHSSKAASTSRAFKLRAVPICLTAFDGKRRCEMLLKICNTIRQRFRCMTERQCRRPMFQRQTPIV